MAFPLDTIIDLWRDVHSAGAGTGYIRTQGTTTNTLVTSPYDYIAVTYPTTSSEQFVFRLGGVSGTVVATVVVTYTDTSKANLLNVAKT